MQNTHSADHLRELEASLRDLENLRESPRKLKRKLLIEPCRLAIRFRIRQELRTALDDGVSGGDINKIITDLISQTCKAINNSMTAYHDSVTLTDKPSGDPLLDRAKSLAEELAEKKNIPLHEAFKHIAQTDFQTAKAIVERRTPSKTLDGNWQIIDKPAEPEPQAQGEVTNADLLKAIKKQSPTKRGRQPLSKNETARRLAAIKDWQRSRDFLTMKEFCKDHDFKVSELRGWLSWHATA